MYGTNLEGISMDSKSLNHVKAQPLKEKNKVMPAGLEAIGGIIRLPENIIGNAARIALYNLLKTNAKLTAVEKINITDDKKYKASEIMKNYTYCQAPKTSRPSMKKIYDELQNTKDYRLSLIHHTSAASMLKPNFTGHGLEVYVSISNDIRPIAPMPLLKRVLGAYFPLENVLFMSGVENNRDFAKAIMMHELTHKVRDLFSEKDKQEVDKAEKEIRNFFKTNTLDPKDEASKFVKESILDRVERARSMYNNQDAIREEMVADVARILVFMEQKPEHAVRMKVVAKPLLDYFDKFMVPKMEQYLVNHPKRKLLDFPDEIRKNLTKYRHVKDNSDNFESSPNKRQRNLQISR
jgi:hypothetical protein